MRQLRSCSTTTRCKQGPPPRAVGPPAACAGLRPPCQPAPPRCRRAVKDLRGVDILTRRPTDQFWLRASSQRIAASGFIKAVPAVGAVVKQVGTGSCTGHPSRVV